MSSYLFNFFTAPESYFLHPPGPAPSARTSCEPRSVCLGITSSAPRSVRDIRNLHVGFNEKHWKSKKPRYLRYLHSWKSSINYYNIVAWRAQSAYNDGPRTKIQGAKLSYDWGVALNIKGLLWSVAFHTDTDTSIPLRTHYQVRVCPNRWLDQTRTKVQMPEGELNCSEKSIEHSRNWSLAIHDHPNMLGKSTISRLCHFRNAAIKGLVDTLGAVFYTWSLSRSTCGFGVS